MHVKHVYVTAPHVSNSSAVLILIALAFGLGRNLIAPQQLYTLIIHQHETPPALGWSFVV